MVDLTTGLNSEALRAAVALTPRLDALRNGAAKKAAQVAVEEGDTAWGIAAGFLIAGIAGFSLALALDRHFNQPKES